MNFGLSNKRRIAPKVGQMIDTHNVLPDCVMEHLLPDIGHLVLLIKVHDCEICVLVALETGDVSSPRHVTFLYFWFLFNKRRHNWLLGHWDVAFWNPLATPLGFELFGQD